LYALPVYFLSFFKAPSGIISKLESLFKRFLWGGGVESRKINWVKWDKICREKEDGGLGIKNLKAFNLALLGKWKWRIQSEKNSLWVRVLASKYGESNGRINRDGSQGSTWWKDINNIERGVWGFKLDWFSEKLSRHLGNGSDTLFWLDPWDEGRTLKERFTNLFVLAENKDISVRNMIYGDEESRQSRLSWSTVLSEGEKQLELEIIEKIQRVLLKENEQDMWIWSKNSYSVKEAYKLLLAEYETEDSRDQLIAWNELVPLKVSVLVWKLLQNKIPTKDNLVKRGILSESQTSCSFGRGKEETVSHVFFECTTVTEVWQEILRWLKINSALHNTTLENYYQFSGLECNLV
jgi:hypothetical protein